MSSFFTSGDLFEYIANELNYTKKELISILGTSMATVSKWKNFESIPSQEMYRKMLHFAKIMNVDTSEFTMELYVENVLSYVYEDMYFLDYIDYQTNKVRIKRSSDGRPKRVELENLTNKKMDLF